MTTRRQRVVLLATSLVVVGGLGFLVGRETAPEPTAEAAIGPDTPVPTGPAPAPSTPRGSGAAGDARDVVYAAAAQELQAVLEAYAAQAQAVVDHEQVAGLAAVLVRHESALSDLATAARGQGTARGDALAALADEVRERASVLRAESASEETGPDGVVHMQAFGREVGVRASRLQSVLAQLAGGRVPDVLEAVAAEVAVPLGSEPGGDEPASATRR